MLLLGIIGLAGSGKTTYAKGKKFETYSFLSPVEIICAYILGEKLEKDKSYKINLGSIDFNFSGHCKLVKCKTPNENPANGCSSCSR